MSMTGKSTAILLGTLTLAMMPHGAPAGGATVIEAQCMENQS